MSASTLQAPWVGSKSEQNDDRDKNAAVLLEEIASIGGTLSEEAGQVVYRAPKGAVLPALRSALREHKAELLELLRSPINTVLACDLVRCADCLEVRYRSPRRPGELWQERLECHHGLLVTLRDLKVPTRYCTLFNRRSQSRRGA